MLELGGKSPNIILDDADFATAIPMAVGACYLNNGQACIAASRLIVPEDRLDEVKTFDQISPNNAANSGLTGKSRLRGLQLRAKHAVAIEPVSRE